MDDFTILGVEAVYQGFVRVDEAMVRLGSATPTRRVCIERGDSAAVLLRHVERNEFLLVRQFRFPTVRHGDPFPLEIVAGGVDEGEEPEDAARREVREELGYRLEAITRVASVYPSPGAASEMVHLFYAEVTDAQSIGEVGGLEGEDVRLEATPVAEVLRQWRSQEIRDAKTWMALSWYQHHNPERSGQTSR